MEVKIDPKVNHGIWEGWGTSLCWMGKVFGNRDDLADFLFTTKTAAFRGENVPGIGLNIVRYNAGACSWNTFDGRKMVISKIIKNYRQMEGFWLDGKDPDPNSASWNWNLDANQRAMLQKAKTRGANHFELFSNSPMWWMCANDNPSGAARAMDDNLPEKNYQAFATYLATIARIARERWGCTFESIEPFNEPMTNYWFTDCKQEGCHFSRVAQARFLPILRAELDRQGLQSVTISASDETNYDSAIDTWKNFNADTKSLVTRINVHGYQYANGRRDELYRLAVEKDGKKLWNSEYGKKDGGGLELARNIHRDMSKLHPTAWCYWQPVDAGGWGFLDADLGKAEILSIHMNAFVLAQYSRHLRPGMIILGSSDANTVTAYDPIAHKAVIVTLNDGPQKTGVFDLSRFAKVGGPLTRWTTEPMKNVRYQKTNDLQLVRKTFTAVLPENAVQTFEVENVLLN